MNKQIEQDIEDLITATVSLEKEKSVTSGAEYTFSKDIESAEQDLIFAKEHLKFLIKNMENKNED